MKVYVDEHDLKKLIRVADGQDELCSLCPWGTIGHGSRVELTVTYRRTQKTSFRVRLRHAYGKIKAAISELIKG